MLALLSRNPDLRALFFAQIVSFAGDWFATVAMLGLVIDRTGSDIAASAVFVVQSLPAFLVTPLAGAAADRLDRRRLMIGVSCVQAAAGLLFLVAVEGPVVLAFVAQAAITALGAFFAPSSQAALPNLVDPEDLPLATVMMSSTWGAMLAVGSALGGAFTVAFGREAAFVADIVTFLLAAALIRSVRRPTQERLGTDSRPRMRPIADTVEALRYARAHPSVAALLASKLGFGFGAGTVGMLALFATGEFGAGDGATGLLLAARGFAVLIGPFVARRLLLYRQRSRAESHIQDPFADIGAVLAACGVSSLAFAVGYTVVGFAPSLALATAGVLFAHLGSGAQWTMSTYGLQAIVPDSVRGRIFAADLALVMLTMSMSLLAAGAIAESVGPRAPTLGMAALAAVWGAVYLALTRRIRSEPLTRP